LHQHLLVNAFYIPVPAATPQAVTVRLFIRDEIKAGDMAGTNFHYAEMQERVPRILFMREQVNLPARGAVVSVAPGEAYRIDNTEPADDISVTCECTRMFSQETTGLPVPENP